MIKLLSESKNFNQKQPASGLLASIRETGYKNCERLGLPTKKSEAWKYTGLKQISDIDWTHAQSVSVTESVLSQITTKLSQDFFNLVFIDGVFNSKISATIGDFKLQNITWSEQYDLSLDQNSDFFESLHGAYFQKRYQLEIQKESQPVRPIHIIHIHLTDKALVQNHVTVNVGGGAKLSILESFICLDNSVLQTLSNSITKINLFDNSFLCYLRNQNENNLAFHLGKTEIRQSQNSQLEISSLSFGAQLSKHELTIELKGQGASSQVFGAAIGNKQQHHDQQTWIKHSVGYCTTKQLYKTLLDGASRAIFNGKVSIALNAQKAFSEQLNSNLLLSAGAEADSRPQLEILADDVKATHGTTVGQLDEDEIFYLMSRAISRERAIEILSFGFIAETVEQLSDMRLKKVALEQIANAFKNLESLQK